MKKMWICAILIGVFTGAMVTVSVAQNEHEAHHPEAAQPAATTATPEMKEQKPGGMAGMPCMNAQTMTGMPQMMGMMGDGKSGMMGPNMMGSGMMGSGMMGMEMMEQKSAHMFFLDRATELGLSDDQVARLKVLQSECRKDNIRTAAEVKIARLDLVELLGRDSWSLKEAEGLVRKVEKLEGDIQVRHLRAVNDARKVLTGEQLKKAASTAAPAALEELFR